MRAPVPQALAWLEESAKSWTHSQQTVYAKVILDEVQRLTDADEVMTTELRKREEQRKKDRDQHLALVREHDRLKDEIERLRSAWDAERTGLERRLGEEREGRTTAENFLRDIHHALLKQPEMSREDIAQAITSVVTPHPEGAKA